MLVHTCRRDIFPHFLDVYCSWIGYFTVYTQALGLESWDSIVLVDWTLKLHTMSPAFLQNYAHLNPTF